jgi:hypothetical protein
VVRADFIKIIKTTKISSELREELLSMSASLGGVPGVSNRVSTTEHIYNNLHLLPNTAEVLTTEGLGFTASLELTELFPDVYMINKLLVDYTHTESHIYTSTADKLYFTKNIYGPYKLLMPNQSMHILTINSCPNQEHLTLLQSFLMTAMPSHSYSHPYELNTDMFVYRKLTVAGRVFTFLPKDFYENELGLLLLGANYPLQLQFQVFDECRGHCRHLLRFIFNTKGPYTLCQVRAFFMQKCL